MRPKTKVSRDMQMTAAHEVPVSAPEITSEVAIDVMVVTFWFNLWGRRVYAHPFGSSFEWNPQNRSPSTALANRVER